LLPVDRLMRTMITGATGFVGLAISEALLEAGHDVEMVSAQPPPLAWLARMSSVPGWRSHICDVGDPNAVADVVSRLRPKAVIHGAAITPSAGAGLDHANRIFQTNALGTLNVLRSAMAVGTTRFIQLSSASVYGDASFGPRELDEVDTPVQPTSMYAVSKFVAERFCRQAAEEHSSMQTLIFRIGSAFGRWEHASGFRETMSAIFQITSRALAGQTVLLPRPCKRDWIYSRDIGEAVLHGISANAKSGTIINLGQGYEWSLEDWCALLERRIAGFNWAYCSAESDDTIQLFAARDRSPLSTIRLRNLGFEPRYDMTAAMNDYLNWAAAPQAQLMLAEGSQTF
jgi:UDP-glucuronate 4-epimerase